MKDVIGLGGDEYGKILTDSICRRTDVAVYCSRPKSTSCLCLVLLLLKRGVCCLLSGADRPSSPANCLPMKVHFQAFAWPTCKNQYVLGWLVLGHTHIAARICCQQTGALYPSTWTVNVLPLTPRPSTTSGGVKQARSSSWWYYLPWHASRNSDQHERR